MLFASADPEQRLLARLRRREEAAFNALVVEHEAKVYRLAWRMLGSSTEAEDLTQEVFVQVFRNIESFRGEAKLSTWIFRVAINLAKNRTKYLGRRRQGSHDELDHDRGETYDRAPGLTTGEQARPDQVAIGLETQAIVARCLGSLAEEYQAVLVLRDVEGLSYEEVSQITELPTGTVKSRLHRARAELRKLVEEQMGEKLP